MYDDYDRRVVAVGVLAVVGGAIAAVLLANAGSPDADMMGLCSNAANERIDDDQCGDWDENGNALTPALPGNYFMWVDTRAYSGQVPPVGQRITIGSRNLPKDRAAAKGAPKTGGNVAEIQRGGFGVKSGSVGGAKSSGGSAGGAKGGSGS